MLLLIPRKSADVRYFIDDRALELDGVREGPAGRFLRGRGNPADAADVARVLQGTTRSTVRGYDLVISASRPISALLAVGDQVEQRSLVAAHQEGVAHVMDYLERRAFSVRRRELGSDVEEPSRVMSAVAFTHGVNRAGEPHLHDHVLFGSADRERGLSIDRRSLQAHLETADALYHAHLRDAVTRTGRMAWRAFDGRDFVEGIDFGVLALWPGGIERGAAKRSWARHDVVAHWVRQLADRVPTPEVTAPRRTSHIMEHAFGAHLAPRHSISRRHIVAAFANAAMFGATAPEINDAVAHLYPEIEDHRGLSEPQVTRAYALQLEKVREFGPRPIRRGPGREWDQRSREADGVDRSR